MTPKFLNLLDLRDLLENLNDGVYFVDNDRRIVYWNRMAERITGYSAEEVIGSRCSDNLLIHVDEKGRKLCLGACPLAHTIQDSEPRTAEVFLHHKEGHRIPVLVRITQLKDDSGKVVGAAEVFTEMSPRAELSQKIEKLEALVRIDDLTRMPNRKHLESELLECFREMRREGLMFGMIFLDIDNFKFFNDTYGHLNGDRILIAVAETLKATSRPYDLFGRWGGEEFVGILRNVDRQALLKLGERYRMLIENSTIPLPEGPFIGVTVSIGATLASPEDSVQTLIHRADHVMYLSKAAGKNRVTIA